VAFDLLELHIVERFLKSKQRRGSKPRDKFLAWLPKHYGFSFREGARRSVTAQTQVCHNDELVNLFRYLVDQIGNRSQESRN
jgi:hypothetical protein